MANVYVRSSAAGTADGTSWANAYTTLAAAQTGAAFVATNTIWLADDHSETTAGSLTYTFPSSPGLRILCANTHVTAPPTGLATTAVVACTGAVTLTFTGYAYIYGGQFSCGSGSSAATIVFGGTAASSLFAESCKFTLASTSTGGRIVLGPSTSTSNHSAAVRLLNSTVSFGSTSQALNPRHGFVHIIGLAIDGAGTAPTSLFKTISGPCGTCLVENSDLSGAAFTNLVDQSVSSATNFTFRNCKLPASVSVTTGSNPDDGAVITNLHNCDSGATNYVLWQEGFAGTVVHETTIVRSGGASNGTTPLSWKMASNANATYPQIPLRSPEIVQWIDTIGSSKTVTIEFVHDTNVVAGQGSGTSSAFKNNEVWMEAMYLSTTGSPVGTFISSAPADVTTGASDDTSSSVTWTTTGLTTPLKQKATVTFTPQQKGYLHARACVGAASKTIYVDPLLTVA